MKNYILYETKNIMGNFMSWGFGVAMPICMTLLFFQVFKGQMPENLVREFATQMYIQNVLMVPLAMVFIGFAATFSQEVEQGIVRRMELFGYSYKKQIGVKYFGQMIVLVIAFIIYSVSIIPLLPVNRPSAGSFIMFWISVFLLALVYFMLAYSIAMLTRKFSYAFGIVMVIYFATMILSGMMGVRPEQFPGVIRSISEMLPTTQIIYLFSESWRTKIGNAAPLLQSFLLLYGTAALLLILAYRKNRRIVE